MGADIQADALKYYSNRNEFNESMTREGVEFVDFISSAKLRNCPPKTTRHALAWLQNPGLGLAFTEITAVSCRRTQHCPMTVRTPEEVINHAIQENRGWERLCFYAAISMVAIGIGSMVTGAVIESGLTAASGTAASALFWPVFRHAQRYRHENLALRMLEIPLSNAQTSEEATKVVISFCEAKLAKR